MLNVWTQDNISVDYFINELSKMKQELRLFGIEECLRLSTWLNVICSSPLNSNEYI